MVIVQAFHSQVASNKKYTVSKKMLAYILINLMFAGINFYSQIHNFDQNDYELFRVPRGSDLQKFDDKMEHYYNITLGKKMSGEEFN